MDDHAGFTFDAFSVDMEDFVYSQVKKFDRLFSLGEGGSFAQQPRVHEGTVYVGCMDRNLYALDEKTGKLKWKFTAEAGMGQSSAVISGGILYIGAHDFNFYAINAGNGRMVWRFRTMGKIAGCGCFHKGRVYFGSADHMVYCVDARTGKLVWKFQCLL